MKHVRGVCVLLLLFCCVLLAACAKDPCADGHTFDEYKIIKKETCASDGEKKLTCSVCGTTEIQVIPATGDHSPNSFVVERPATLREKGSKSQYCKKCEQCINTVEIPAIADTVTVSVGDARTSLDLSACVIRYDGATANKAYESSVVELCRALESYTGKTVEMRSFTQAGTIPASCEILIGHCNAPEVTAALAQIAGNGFALTANGGKLVIVGSDSLQTLRAMQYFVYENLSGGGGTALSVPTSAVAKDVPLTTFATKKELCFELAYSQQLDDDKPHKYVAGDENTDSRDYPCVAAEQLAAELSTRLSVDATEIVVRDDVTRSPYELLIGTFPDRLEAESFRHTLDGHEYGILVHDGQILLAAHNDAVLKECISAFLTVLELAEGSGGFAFPDGLCLTFPSENNWVTDFPRPDGAGISLFNTQYNNDDSLQYLYTGEGVTPAAYQSYCAQLVSAGYVIISENSIEGSLFATFVNREKGITIYAAYNDYKYEADYAKKDEYDVDFQKCIRVITAPLGSVTLPDEGLLTPNPSYNKVTDGSITALPFTGQAVGMGYVIQLEDGRFIVIDGGGVNTGGNEYDRLWDTMYALYKDANGGREPTTAAPVTIAAWINTHSHWDHYYAFQQMLKKYGRTGRLRMQYMLGNFPEASSIYAVQGSSLHMGTKSTIDTMKSYVAGGFEYVKVHTGQKFYLANATLEILMTYEDHNPRRICNSNDTCTIVRFELENSDAPAGTNPVTAIFLADAFRFQSRYLCAMYGSYLKSDIAQLAHHGNIGCEKEVYQAIAPTTVFFPNGYDAFYTYTESNTSKWNYEVDRYVVKLLESVKFIYVAEAHCLSFALTPSGPDYVNIYDITRGKVALSFDGRTAIRRY